VSDRGRHANLDVIGLAARPLREGRPDCLHPLRQHTVVSDESGHRGCHGGGRVSPLAWTSTPKKGPNAVKSPGSLDNEITA
jgi:hypothetical protein